MSATTNTATSSVLDDVTKRYNDAWSNYNAAVEQRNQAVQARAARPDEPGTSYEDFLKGAMPEQPTTQIDPKKEKSRMWVTNIADAINAVSGIVGAASGADVAPMASLSDVNKKRYDKLVEQRKAEQNAYNKALMQAQSHAMSMSEAYRRKRQQEDAQAAALDDARVAQAKMAYDKAATDYGQAYKEHRDVVGDTYRTGEQNRLVSQHQDEVNYRNAQGQRADRDDVESHNINEQKQWHRIPGGSYVRNEDYNAFIDKVYSALLSDSNTANDLKSTQAQVKIAETKGDTKSANALKETVVNRYLSSSDENMAKVARDAASGSGFYGEPDFWSLDNNGQIVRGSQSGNKKTIPGF